MGNLQTYKENFSCSRIDVSIISPFNMIWSCILFLISNAQNPCVPYDPNNPGSPWERYCRSGKDFIPAD